MFCVPKSGDRGGLAASAGKGRGLWDVWVNGLWDVWVNGLWDVWVNPTVFERESQGEREDEWCRS
jgi:hypothetical protein